MPFWYGVEDAEAKALSLFDEPGCQCGLPSERKGPPAAGLVLGQHDRPPLACFSPLDAPWIVMRGTVHPCAERIALHGFGRVGVQKPHRR